MKKFTTPEIMLIYKALLEYELTHYMTIDEKQQKRINNILNYFKNEIPTEE